ncbi:putative methyltransferase-domain-containing protein [Syncephalis pseudoplumigaleata]|uniref:Protein N-terminal and lysine N-methyltransferase EFM7 n=1 Tax=Syncephalis pseudoplumigaleata TaxID=1712513 RepID=A0A4P9Z620_9FUNG|nr:putative methyltransferase-domain-containing protein [Syncephalis pseudoplumigaleata]|eukprot:RKP27271.1 putative methyltransferase-domain-containing protein [Syncephalis pseudoplumigaleata]
MADHDHARCSSTSDHEDDTFMDAGMFEEPEAFRPPSPVATFVEHERPADVTVGPSTLRLRLVGAHPLWGHHLWNAARVFANYLEARAATLCRGRRVLELGAGAGLPGLVTALHGAQRVLLTDYPDADLLDNLTMNAKSVASDAYDAGHLAVQGYLWGADTRSLVAAVNEHDAVEAGTFDLVILSDLIFNHTEHRAMLQTVRACLSRAAGLPVTQATLSRNNEALQRIARDAPCPPLPPLSERETAAPQALVFFSHHRPWWAARDLHFFELAQSSSPIYGGFHVERILEEQLQPMFAEDPGSAEVRATVHGYRLTLREHDNAMPAQ